MKSFAMIALAGAAYGAEIDTKFMEYIVNHGKSYGTLAEYNFRMNLFATADALIEEHNNKNGESYTLGHNLFSDWTDGQRKRLLGYKPLPYPVERNPLPTANKILADSVDWVSSGAVTPVKDQGQCGSCWTFSSTGAMEGINAIKNKTLDSFSEQFLVDCDTLTNSGCEGGNFVEVFGRFARKHKMFYEKDWPYKGVDEDCSTATPSV